MGFKHLDEDGPQGGFLHVSCAWSSLTFLDLRAFVSFVNFPAVFFFIIIFQIFFCASIPMFQGHVFIHIELMEAAPQFSDALFIVFSVSFFLCVSFWIVLITMSSS